MTFPTYPQQTIAIPARQLVSFPASGPLGLVTRLWLWWLRLYINGARYTITLRGRTAKTPTDRAYGGGIKLNRANRWGVYLDDKFGPHLERYHRAIGEHEEKRRASDELAREKEYTNRQIAKCSRLTTELREAKEGSGELAASSMVSQVTAQRDSYQRLLQESREAQAAVVQENERWKERYRERVDTIHKIKCELSGKEWSADTPQEIAAILTAQGYHIAGYDPAELEPMAPHTNGPAAEPKPGKGTREPLS